MAILVTGGAGYIGSITVQLLREQGHEVVILDNLSHGHRASIPADVPLVEGDVGDRRLVADTVREYGVDACVHFAALIFVGESVQQPTRYYANNVAQGVGLIEALLENGVKRLVFSSTAAVYGEPETTPIAETHPLRPANPYGWSKRMVEQVLADADAAHGLKYVALRYFNACGALPGKGEDHHPENHLIPLVLQVALGQRAHISIFGDDYPTRDGSAVRDYIHVADLGDAHLRALAHLAEGGPSLACNLGNGQGYTVKEVIAQTRQVTGREIPAELAPRRAGDPSHLVADAALARRELDWQPQRPELAAIIQSAWDWHREHPRGYDDQD